MKTHVCAALSVGARAAQMSFYQKINWKSGTILFEDQEENLLGKHIQARIKRDLKQA
jgi:hypothetical protein